METRRIRSRIHAFTGSFCIYVTLIREVITMYLRDLKASLLRRWYLVLGGLLLTAGICTAAYQLVPATYQAQASVVMLPPNSSVSKGGNPYLYLGGLGQALDVLTRALQADSAQRPITDAHPDSTYTALPDTTTTGPILLVTVDGPTPGETLATLHAVLASVPPALVSLQDGLGVAANSRITSMNLAADEQPTKIQKDQTRALLAAAAVGLVATVLLTGVIDGLLTSRKAGERKELDSVRLTNGQPPYVADPLPRDGRGEVGPKRRVALRKPSARPSRND